MPYSSHKNLLSLAVLSFCLLISCSSSENTTVVEEAPTTSEKKDTAAVQQPSNDGNFRQLTMGETMPIRSLDPLFVENASGMRALQLIYEGLVRYNEDGEITPAIAKKWAVTDNQQTYRFTLRNDLYYHDSNAFANGLGRRLVASDIKFVFERMAGGDVPDRAAQLFMDIRGFEPYFQEQHQIMMESERQLNSVSGIKVVNDSTITFSLMKPDEHFINKLAAPHAVIYPKEALTRNGFTAVGTGPFKLSQKRSDALYILARFEDYRTDGVPKLNRVDIRTGTDQAAMLNALNNGNTQLIPQLGPQQMQMLLNANGQLKQNMSNNFTLYDDKGESAYFLRYHEGADLSNDAVVNALQTARGSDFFEELPPIWFEVLWPPTETSANPAADSLAATFSGDPFVRSFYDQLSQQLESNEIVFSMNNSRVANRNTPLFMDSYFSSYDTQIVSTSAMATLVFQSLGVAQKDVQNINFNNLPWWIDLREVSFSSTDNNR